MREIFGTLSVSAIVLTELLSTTIFAHVLALATPIFVILVFNRYIMYGFDGTLLTLTAGAVIAVALEYTFRRLRHRFVAKLVEGRGSKDLSETFKTLVSAKELGISSLPISTKRRIFQDASYLKRFVSSDNICLVLDAPFSVIYILAIYLLSPWLALITATFCVLYFFLATYWSYQLGKRNIKAEQLESREAHLIDFGMLATESVRLFGIAETMLKEWASVNRNLKRYSYNYSDQRNVIQGRSRVFTSILTIGIIAMGAQLVVDGTLDIGSLIGINILAARAAMPIIGTAQIFDSISRVALARRAVRQFNTLPTPLNRKIGLQNYSGRVIFEQVNFAYLTSSNPVFKGLSVEIDPGEVVVVRGPNGAGKTTLIRLLTGILEPSSGSILVDNINLKQISSEWWRKQIMYMPQEPTFYETSIQNNLEMHRSDLSIRAAEACMKKVGLNYIVDETEEGLQTLLSEGGKNLSLGVRRRVSLARSLVYDGALVLLDEPTENVDAEGKKHIYNLLNEFSSQKKTIICSTIDPVIIKGASKFIDLSFQSDPKIILTTLDSKDKG